MASDRFDEFLFLLSIFVLTLLVQLPLLTVWPFVTDENLYALMISQQMHSLTLLPTLFEYTALWKPPLFFWIYSILVQPLLGLDIPLEVVYRLPTLLFGLLCTYAVYFLLKETGLQGIQLHLTTVLYALSPIVLYTNSSVLTDTLAQLFIFLALIFYFKKGWPLLRFIGAAFFIVLSFFTKFLVVAMVPFLVVVYFWFNDRHVLKQPLLWGSFLAIPLALGIHSLIVNNPSEISLLYGSDMIGNFTRYGFDLDAYIALFYTSGVSLLQVLGFWFFLSLAGFIKNWQEHKFHAIWYLFITFPFLTAGLRPWYFLPIALPIAYFSVLALGQWKSNKFHFDRFATFGLCLFLFASTVMASMFFWALSTGYHSQKTVGEFLVGKENVLLFGDYWIESVAYKVLNEERKAGTHLDFGWIFVPSVFNHSFDSYQPQPYVFDYSSHDPLINDLDINRIYWKTNTEIFRKKTSITHFDYLVAIGNYSNLDDLGTVLYNTSRVQVIKLKNSSSN